ncbi:MAG: AAA family ATPase [Nitratireductor sp.]|uniref:AAA family ATPase n=1 Tax=Nitratireductor sp. TaxID=1872084 RepID=UPI002610F4DD|nr:AAA family ATPase [Nitratireductor sp.]MCV0350165.1 AAA family ATPase [Nitratireductor sp.]
MLNHLKYNVTFPSTGRSLSGDFSFQKGFGAITGPNEAGKSVILEMIRYSLFGTAALRGKSDDYKDLKVELRFSVRGDEYRTQRTISRAKLFRGDEEIANGVKGVNNKVVEILGFGLEVFDTACVANQGDIEKLGSMLPSERKRMVDSVIGLSVIDELAKWCGDEARTIASTISGMEDSLVKPAKPVEPENYCNSDSLTAPLEHLRGKRDELNQVKGRLSKPLPAKPTEPVEPCEKTAQELEEELEQARAYETAQNELKRLPAPPEVDPDTIEDDFDAWESRENIRRNYPTTMTAEQIAKADADTELVRKFERMSHLLQKHEDLVAVGTHTCPACDHQWPVEQERVEQVAKELDDLREQLAGVEIPSKPDMVNVDVARRQLQAFDKVKDEWERVKDAEKPKYTRQQVAQFQVAKEAQGRRAELEAVPATSQTSKELNALYRERLAYEQKVETFQDQLVAWEEAEADRSEDEERALELQAVPTQLAELEKRYEDAKIFEDRMEEYEKSLSIYESKLTEIKDRRAQEEGYRKGKDALVILRRLVKQHLIPSLNKVASHYLSKMTGGQRNIIDVSEEFEITVDGQPINTLSGSGKAVANLSLRLGLGQVLTNNQFSVFLGDEIDASMDADRAHNTALTLEYLAERISQILLVSHKYPQADYYIELEGNEQNIH